MGFAFGAVAKEKIVREMEITPSKIQMECWQKFEWECTELERLPLLLMASAQDANQNVRRVSQVGSINPFPAATGDTATQTTSNLKELLLLNTAVHRGDRWRPRESRRGRIWVSLHRGGWSPNLLSLQRKNETFGDLAFSVANFYPDHRP